MNKIVLFALTVLFVAGWARATSPLLIDITTTDRGTTYTLNSVSKTPDELGRWFVDTIKQFGPIMDNTVIRPDDRTTFVIVLDIALRLKAAGVTRLQVVSGLPNATKDEWGELLIAPAAIDRRRLPPKDHSR
ncbi:MAG TPA: hypothetical protein VIT91_02985 [Chthoniobacterales bacterium]